MYMPNKTKNTKTTTERLNEAAMQGGIVMMAAAATLGMLELPEHQNSRVIVPVRPVFAMASDGTDNAGQGNQLQREREETAPHYISYSIIQRTAGRTGKR